MRLPAPDASGIIRFENGIVIDLPRAEIVCEQAFEGYRMKQGLHAIIKHAFDAPQSRFIPFGVKRGSPQHILWLFFTALTDRREVSESVYRAAAELYAESPWTYGPGSGSSKEEIDRYLSRLAEVVLSVEIPDNPIQLILLDTTDIFVEATEVIVKEVDTIANILRKKKVGSPGQSATYWPRVAETLYREFGGDPLEIFRRYPTIDAFLAFKRDWKKKTGNDPFPGIGAKIASLMTMFYDELGLMSMPEDAMPVDVHLQRFALETGIIRYEGTKRLTNEMVERPARALYCHICNENRWTHVDFSHAIWFLSKRLCSSCHRKKIAQTLCPIFDLCLGSIASASYFRRGVWEIKHRQKNGGMTHL